MSVRNATLQWPTNLEVNKFILMQFWTIFYWIIHLHPWFCTPRMPLNGFEITVVQTVFKVDTRSADLGKCDYNIQILNKDRFGCKFLGKTRVKLSYLGIEEQWGAKSTLTVSHVCCFCFYVEHLFQFLLWLVISFLMNWYKTSYYQNSRTDLKQTVLLYIEFAYLSTCGWYDHVQL